MSLITGPRARKPITTQELSTRLRRFGLKGLPQLDVEDNIKAVLDLGRLDDSGHSDYPRRFHLPLASPAVGAQNSFALLQGRTGRTVIDQLILTAGALTTLQLQLNRIGPSGGGGPVVNTTHQSTAGPLSKATGAIGSLGGINAGQIIGYVNVIANTTYIIPVSIRLGPPDPNTVECLEVWGVTVNVQVIATFIGREWDEQ